MKSKFIQCVKEERERKGLWMNENLRDVLHKNLIYLGTESKKVLIEFYFVKTSH